MLLMGIGRRTITPPLTIPHAGWGAQTHMYAEGIEADFYTTAMIISDGHDMSVIIDADAGSFTIEHTQEIRDAVAAVLDIHADHVRLSVTHTHAGAMLWTSYNDEERNNTASYIRYVKEQTAAAALEARDTMTQVTVDAGFGECTIGINRRQRLDSGRVVVGADFEGTTDTAVGVVRFEDDNNQTVATLVQYACHPTTLGFTNKLLSPDYPGAMRPFVERNLGGVCLFLQGSAGNIGPGPEGFMHNVAAMRRIGSTLGAAAVQTALEIEARSYSHDFASVIESGAPLGLWNSTKSYRNDSFMVMSTRIPIPLKSLMPVEEARSIHTAYEREFAEKRQRASEEELKEITYKLKRAYIQLHSSEKYDGQTTAAIETHFTRVGDIVLIGAQIEPFCEIGLRIKQISPFPFTFFGGYSNGVMGYLPVAKSHDEGGYEVETSPYAPEAAEVFVQEVGKILRGLL